MAQKKPSKLGFVKINETTYIPEKSIMYYQLRRPYLCLRLKEDIRDVSSTVDKKFYCFIRKDNPELFDELVGQDNS